MLNKCILMGRLTRDPELRHTASNTPVTTFTLAVDRNVKRTNDNAQQTADFIDIVAWDAKADFAAKWFRKGQLVAVCGRLQSRKWQDNEGRNRVVIEVIADELHFAESRKEASGGEFRTPTPVSTYSAASDDIAPSAYFSELPGDGECPF